MGGVQKLGGIDPDFHRRDLWNAIEAGAFPQWDLGVQVMPDNEDQTFEGIDLLDPTKIVPEELCPVRLVGRMTLDANPANFFAETEQVAFHPGHVPPGIDLTDDPLLHARLFFPPGHPDRFRWGLGIPDVAEYGRPEAGEHVAITAVDGDAPNGAGYVAWCQDIERHEALPNPAVVKGHRHVPVAAGALKLRAA